MTSWRCQDALGHAEKLLSRHPLIDGHIDVPVVSRYLYDNKVEKIPFDQPAFENGSYPTYGHVDIPRLRAGRRLLLVRIRRLSRPIYRRARL